MTSSSPSRTSPPWTLEQVLCAPEAQRDIIFRGATAIAAANGARFGEVIGVTAEKPTPSRRNMTAAQLVAVPPENDAVRERVAGYFQAVAHTEVNQLVLSWCVLAMMALFPACAAEVRANSGPRCAPWFDGAGTVAPFAVRFELHIAGSDATPAKTGVQIVVAEWQLFSKITG